MRVFIREFCRDVYVHIYGTDGEERTREFFQMYFINTNTVGIYETTEEEHEQFKSEAIYTIATATAYKILTEQIERIQAAIDAVAAAMIDKEPAAALEEYSFENKCYIV